MRRLVRGISIGIALALLAGGLAYAQEQGTRTEIRNGKVVYVAPGTIAIRGKNGVKIFTKADWKDIKVEKDGATIDPDQLHKGDIVTATIVTANEPPTATAEQMKTYDIPEEAGTGDMTSERIIWTEIKKGKVRGVGPTDLLVKTDSGLRHFTKDEWKDTKIWKDGQAITPDKLHVGDVVTATFITKASPTVTEQQAAQYETKPAPAPPAPKPAAKPAPAPPAPAPAAAPAAAPAPAPAPAPAAEHKKLPKTASSVPAVGLAGLAFLGLGLALTASRRLRRS